MVTQDTGIKNEQLIAWVRGLYGPGRTFENHRDLALAAGRNAAAVYTLEQEGRATGSLLIDLARASGESPLRALLIGGHLTQEEIDPTGLLPEESERALLECYVSLPRPSQRLVRELCQQLAETARA